MGYSSPEANKLMSVVKSLSNPALTEAAVSAALALDDCMEDLASMEEQRILTSKQLSSIKSHVAVWRELEGKLQRSTGECEALRERVRELSEEVESRAVTEEDLRGRLTAAAEAGLRIEGELAAEALRCREEFARQREEMEALRRERDSLLEQHGEGGAPPTVVEARAAALQAQLQNLGILIKHRDAILVERDAQRMEIERLEALLEEARETIKLGAGRVNTHESSPDAVTLRLATPLAKRFSPRTPSPESSPAMLNGEDVDQEISPPRMPDALIGSKLRKVKAKGDTAPVSGCCTVA